MSRRVVGYEGTGRARRPIYADDGPATAKVFGIITGFGRHGMAVVAGELVRGTSEAEAHRLAARLWKRGRS